MVQSSNGDLVVVRGDRVLGAVSLDGRDRAAVGGEGAGVGNGLDGLRRCHH